MRYAIFVLIFSIFIQTLLWTHMPYDTDSFHFMKYARSPEDFGMSKSPDDFQHETMEPPTGVGSLLPTMVHSYGVFYTRMILMLLSAAISVLIYLIIRRWLAPLGAFLISALFSLDPLWLMQSTNIVDKNMIYMFALIVIAWTYQADFKIPKGIKIAVIALYIFIVILTWEGWPLIAAFVVVMLITRVPMRFKFWMHLISFTLISVMLGNRLVSSSIVREMRPAYMFLSPFYIIYIVVIIWTVWELLHGWLDNKPNPWFTDILFVTMIAALLIFRNIIFFIPFLYISAAWTFSRATRDRPGIEVICISSILAFFIVTIIMLSAPGYMRSSVWTPDMEKALLYADTMDTSCIITDWGIGNIAQYYTDKAVPMRGHPDMDKIGYYILEDASDCTAVYSTGQDELFQRYADMLNHTHVNIYDRKIIKEYNDWKVS